MDILENIGECGLLSAIEISKAEDAIPLGTALLNGGLSIAEITFRTEAASEALHLMAKTYPEMIIGAGSIVRIEQAKEAIDAGAKFIVSAGFNQELVDWCKDHEILTIPGVATASEISLGLLKGLKVLKFFPVEAMGGVNLLKALSAPFPGIKFIPMGGISPDNLTDYIKLPFVHACGGSWSVSKRLLSDMNFSKITELTKQALSIVKETRRNR